MSYLAMTCESCGSGYNAFEIYCPACDHAPARSETLFVLYDKAWPLEAFYNLAFGEDPCTWPLPEGQSLPWKDWTRALNHHAVKREWNPQYWPMGENDIIGGNCWVADWIAGKTPEQTAEEHHESQIAKN